jgi:transcriptional regulator with XRE-family HTH domain
MSDVRRMSGMALIEALTCAYGVPVAGDDEGGRRFAALLRDYRGRLGLRQQDVADKSGVSLSTINRWERGDVVNPKPDEVRAVCRVLHLPPIKAVVALGYVEAETLDELPELPQYQPTTLEIIELLENPAVPAEVKRAAISYVRFLSNEVQSEGGTAAAS